MENIYRLRDDGITAQEASVLGTKEVIMPVFTATMTKIAVFLPIVFVEGIAATLFKEFSYTISFALICSLLVALTVVPMLCSKLMNTKDMGTHIKIRKHNYELKLLPLFERGLHYVTEEYLKFLEVFPASQKKDRYLVIGHSGFFFRTGCFCWRRIDAKKR